MANKSAGQKDKYLDNVRRVEVFTYSKPLLYCRPAGRRRPARPSQHTTKQVSCWTQFLPSGRRNSGYIHSLKHVMITVNADGMSAAACDGAVRNKYVDLYLHSGGTRFEFEFGDRLAWGFLGFSSLYAAKTWDSTSRRLWRLPVHSHQPHYHRQWQWSK